MREDLIHDALNMLDDDLISEVEYLRSRKNNRRKQWGTWAAMAACMCIALGGVYVALGDYMNASTESGSMENMTESTGDGEAGGAAEESVQEQESVADIGSVESEAMKETPAFLVKVKEWNEGGFTGIIVEIVDTELYPVGTEVYVDTTGVLQLADANVQYTEGTVLHVQFYKKAEAAQITLYAEEIWQTEME